MKKREYKYPIIEVLMLDAGVLMQEWLAGSLDHGSVHAPERRPNAF
jgi:hypothetical protein